MLKFMIVIDSGNAHIANAVGTPAVVLFGATTLNRAFSYTKVFLEQLIIRRYLVCHVMLSIAKLATIAACQPSKIQLFLNCWMN